MPTSTTVRTTVVTQGPTVSFVSVQSGFISTISGILTAIEMVGGVVSAASRLLFIRLKVAKVLGARMQVLQTVHVPTSEYRLISAVLVFPAV